MHGFELFKLKVQAWRILFGRFQLQMMKIQPEGLETTRDAMEEDLIEESAFYIYTTSTFCYFGKKRSKEPTTTPREPARNHLQTSTNEKHQHAKVKETRRRRSFLGQRRKRKCYFFKKIIFNSSFFK